MDDHAEPADSPFVAPDGPSWDHLEPPPLPHEDPTHTAPAGGADATVDTKWVPPKSTPPSALRTTDSSALPPTPPLIGSTRDSAPPTTNLTPPPLDFSFLGSAPEPIHPTVTEADLPIIDRTGRDTLGLLTALLGPLLWVVGLGGAWYLLTRGTDPIVSAGSWPSLSATWETLKDMVDQTSYRDAVLDSAVGMVLALAVGSALGLAVGWLSGQNRVVANLLRPLVSLFRLLSPVLVLFILIIWSNGDWVVWAAAALGVFAMSSWTVSAARHDSRRRLQLTQSELIVRGLRSSLPLAWAILYAAEFIADRPGIGSRMFRAGNFSALPEMVVWLLTALVLAIVADAGLRLLQRLLSNS